jgi:DNA helicase IV
VEDQEEKLKRLTTAQETILGMLAKQPRAAIEGVAGSGKTILAMGQAQRFARQGKKTLLLCFNRPLADWLDQQLPAKFRELVSIDTFHRLCSTFCKQAKIPFNGSAGDDEFWSFTAPDLLEQACKTLGPELKFEAIVVDEGQDFHELWWMALEKVQRAADAAFPLYVFYDPKQNIYISQPTLPSNLAGPFVLPTNCRNTRLIARLCGEIIHETIDVHEEAPNGSAPRIVMAVSDTDVVKRAREQVQEWCLRERGNVAVLTPTDPGKEWPASFGNIPLTDNFDHWRASNGVLLSTCRRFKGLEADALVLAGIPKPDTKKYFTNADYYVAASRGKHLLTVITTEAF